MDELKKRIYDEGKELYYMLVGDYYILDLRLPEKRCSIGKCGRLHLEYLRETQPTRLQTLTLTGKLIVCIQQMEWVQRMNSIHNRAEEIVMNELIYNINNIGRTGCHFNVVFGSLYVLWVFRDIIQILPTRCGGTYNEI